MKTIKYLTFILSLSVVIFSCKDDEDKNVRDLVLPSNLSATIEVDSTDFKTVTVTASATNANFFTVTFFDSEGIVEKETQSGVASHEFTFKGTYRINIKANALTDQFIQMDESVTLTLGEPGNNGNPPTSGYTTPTSYPNYTLVWQEEFDGSALNTANWNYETGTGSNGWGNNELQYYREENVEVGNGLLTITAKNEFFGGSNYTSSRITTEGKKEFQYGRMDIRAAMPFGQGMWPAVWMLGNTFRTDGWPRCGEIDIMEMVGGTVQGGGDNVTHGTAHWYAESNSVKADEGRGRVMPEPLANNWHVYSIVWDANSITWYIDDNQYFALNTTSNDFTEFRNPFFFIVNCAVGGNWPGSPNANTTFPQKMYVDYIRVFQ